MTADGEGLVVRELSVRYGGLTAVKSLTLHAPPARLTGLIGPNGAGKTTTFNALSGLVTPADGSVELFGHDVTRTAPHGRARLGLGRTFQRIELFDSLTVEQNVALGREAGLAGSNPIRHVVRSRSERQQVASATGRALELCQLGDVATRRAGALSTGQRRLVELARAVAGDFRILLLDEPSSGLDVAETRRFGQILCALVSEGVGILLVEHDMALVMDICEYLYVIDFGEQIFEGTAKQASTSEVVRAAYLGDEAVEAAVR